MNDPTTTTTPTLAQHLSAIRASERRTGGRDLPARRAFNRALRAGGVTPALVGGARKAHDSQDNGWRVDGGGVGEVCAIRLAENQTVRIEQSLPIMMRNVSFGASTNVLRSAFGMGDKLAKTATAGDGGGEVVVAPRSSAAISLARLSNGGSTLYIARRNLLAASSSLSLGVSADLSVWSRLTDAERVFTSVSGDGVAAFCAHGSLLERALKEGESVRVEPAALVAYDSGVSVSTVARTRTWGVMGVQRLMGRYDGLNRYLFECHGPGRIFVQTRERGGGGQEAEED